MTEKIIETTENSIYISQIVERDGKRFARLIEKAKRVMEEVTPHYVEA